MKKKSLKHFMLSEILFQSFIIFTTFVFNFDVKPIGPEKSEVGFATINRFVFQAIGVHPFWHGVTDCLGAVAILIASGSAAMGLWQLIKRKSIRKVGHRILVLGLLYILLFFIYLLFELAAVNYRPVLLDNSLEASYPSSHTVIAVCIMATTAMQVRDFFPNKKKLCLGVDTVATLITIITVAGRLFSGVHWFTDILGGLLLSAALVMLYCAVIEHLKERE